MNCKWHLRLSVILLAVGLLATALPAAAETVAMAFHWEPSPLEEGGVQHPAAAFYEVFLLRGADGEAFAATVDDTTWVLEAESGVVQRIAVRGVDAEGNASPFSEWSDPVYFESRSDPQGAIPPAPDLGANYPNPFNPETRIVYGVPDDLAHGTAMRLEIYTIDGRRVRTLPVNASAGWHEVVWDGRDDLGQPSAAGTYITRYAAGTMVKTGKMTMVK